jgi:hypothetical protein
LLALAPCAFASIRFAAADEGRPHAYLQGAGVATIGVEGLADGIHPGVTVGAGIRFSAWSAGLGISFSTIRPKEDQYAYALPCLREAGNPCPRPVLEGTFGSIDVEGRLHPIALGPIEPFLEVRIGYNGYFLSDPNYANVGQTDFAMQGFHLAGAVGVRLEMISILGIYASGGYSFSVVDPPPTIESGDGLLTDLVYIVDQGHQIQFTLGVSLVL